MSNLVPIRTSHWTEAKPINDERVGNLGTIAGLTMGGFPNSDFVLGLFNRQFYIEYHRDFTQVTTEGNRFYYWFARFPVACSMNSNHGTHRVEFMDLRFLLPGVRTPFKYYLDFDESGEILSEGFWDDRKGGKTGDNGSDRDEDRTHLP